MRQQLDSYAVTFDCAAASYRVKNRHSKKLHGKRRACRESAQVIARQVDRRAARLLKAAALGGA